MKRMPQRTLGEDALVELQMRDVDLVNALENIGRRKAKRMLAERYGLAEQRSYWAPPPRRGPLDARAG